MLTNRGLRPAWAWLDRLAPAASCMAAVGALFAFAVAAEDGSPIGFVVMLVPAAAALALVAVRRRSLRERPWDGASPVAGARSAASAARARVGAGEGGSRVPWRTAAALGRVEARELACSPWFALGVAFQLWLFLSFGLMYAEEDNDLWAMVVRRLVWFCHPLVGMTVVASHAARTRARHAGTEELLTSCPASTTTRTVALLSTAWVPVAGLATFLGAYMGSLIVARRGVYGPVGTDAIPDLLAALALGLGGTVLGVAVGRWVPSRLAPICAVVTVGVLSLRMAAGAAWTPWAKLSSFPKDIPELFQHRSAWWYLAWLLGLTATVAGVALAPSRRAGATGRFGSSASPALTLAVLGVTVATIAALMVNRPVPAGAARALADRIGQPAAHQRCAPATPAVQVCSYAEYGDLAGRIVSDVTPVAAALPAAIEPVTLRMVYAGDVGDLPPEVARLLPGGIADLPPGEVALPVAAALDLLTADRLLVALSAVDLPVTPEIVAGGAEGRSGRPQPNVVAGQARGVVALWLAAQGLDAEAAARVATAHRRGKEDPPGANADAFERGFAWSASCESAPVVWSAQDLAAVRSLLRLPPSAVTAAVHARWDHWRDPSAGTDELLTAVGAAPVGPFDAVVSRDPGRC